MKKKCRQELDRGTYIHLEIRSQDDKKLPQWYCRCKINTYWAAQHINEEVDEAKEEEILT